MVIYSPSTPYYTMLRKSPSNHAISTLPVFFRIAF
nr:MAG TPA: hypothetical protein [Caudoviricetes sp.]